MAEQLHGRGATERDLARAVDAAGAAGADQGLEFEVAEAAPDERERDLAQRALDRILLRRLEEAGVGGVHVEQAHELGAQLRIALREFLDAPRTLFRRQAEQRAQQRLGFTPRQGCH